MGRGAIGHNTRMPPTYLNVPFRDKDVAKALGARWDPAQRQWYVPEGRVLTPFMPWLLAGIEGASATSVSVSVAAEPEPAYGSFVSRPDSLSLSQLLAGVAQLVAQACPGGVWTLVEVVDVRSRNGHVYLELSERDAQGQVLARANAMIWASTASRLLPEFEHATGAVLAAGIKLLARARPVFKPQYGFSLEIDALDAAYTLGDLEAGKREIRERLRREGLYQRQQQLAPPWDYNFVLVLAPEGGAGLGDFQVEAGRLQRHGLCRFRYAYSRFQGEGAAAEMRVALLVALAELPLREQPDAVAIIRGGGAVNDLAWLNDYALARALCELDLPVLTGIGHERDQTLLDEVAQQRFDTPSKVIAGIEQLIAHRAAEVRANFAAIAQLGQRQIARSRLSVQQLDAEVRLLARRQLDLARQRVPAAWAEIEGGARLALRQAREGSQALMREIAGQGSDKTLARGFAVVRDASGYPLQRAAEVSLGQPLRIEFHDGSIQARAEP